MTRDDSVVTFDSAKSGNVRPRSSLGGFAFGPFQLDVRTRRLLRDGREVRLTPLQESSSSRSSRTRARSYPRPPAPDGVGGRHNRRQQPRAGGVRPSEDPRPRRRQSLHRDGPGPGVLLRRSGDAHRAPPERRGPGRAARAAPRVDRRAGGPRDGRHLRKIARAQAMFEESSCTTATTPRFTSGWPTRACWSSRRRGPTRRPMSTRFGGPSSTRARPAA